MATSPAHMTNEPVRIRPLSESDLSEADRILQVAFGTFLGVPDPASSVSDTDYVFSRWRASPHTAFALESDGRLAGSNFATRWGSFAFFGPLTVDPALQDQGHGTRLIEPVIELFERWGVAHAGLFTFAHSPKHVGLYQKFGFRPRALTVIMEKPLDGRTRCAPSWTTLSGMSPQRRSEMLLASRSLTDRIYSGLDVTGEMESIAQQSLGDTVVATDNDLLGFAACHVGRGTEAGNGTCYLKFGAARTRDGFTALLEAAESFAVGRRAERIVAGMNTARVEAYEAMLRTGFRVSRTGVAMHRPNAPGFSRPGVFVIDDWR